MGEKKRRKKEKWYLGIAERRRRRTTRRRSARRRGEAARRRGEGTARQHGGVATARAARLGGLPAVVRLWAGGGKIPGEQMRAWALELWGITNEEVEEISDVTKKDVGGGTGQS